MTSEPARARPDPERPRALAIVPARLGSRRLPGKMLLAETGRCLFVHTAENLARCPAIDRVVVATDSEEIRSRARDAGLEAVLTRDTHESGTDRAHEALSGLGPKAWDVVVDVQGDEPELDPRDLERLVAAFRDPSVAAATLAGPLEPADAERSGVVKVVRTSGGDALYFSRAPIPFRPAPGDPAAYAASGAARWEALARRHIGVYGFRPPALARFCALPRGALERLENLEQLRWLEAGLSMRVVEAQSVPLGIDTAEDYHAFVERVRRATAGRAP